MRKAKKMKRLTGIFNGKTLRSLSGVVLVLILLYFGRALFIPLSFALLISFILYPICNWLEHHKFSRTAAIGVGITLMLLLFSGLIFLLGQQLLQFSREWPHLSDKMDKALHELSIFVTRHYKINSNTQQEWVQNFAGRIISFLGISLYNSSASIVLALLIPVYAALILYHRKLLAEVLLSFFPKENADTVILVLHETIHTYYNFIKGMLLVYLIVGILNSAGLLVMGLPNAFLFGFIASILTFIPYVGIIIASLLPITVAWLTHDSVWYPVGVVIIFALVQYLEANIIFPLAVSNRLKINTLFTIAVMIAGGIIWGAAGMILFIPFAGIVKLVADQVSPHGTLSTLMGPGK